MSDDFRLDSVVLKPGATFFKASYWDREADEQVELDVANLWRFTGCYLEIELGATLEDFMRCLENALAYPGAKAILEDYCQCNLMALLEDMRQEPDDRDDNLKYLQVSPVVSCDKYGKNPRYDMNIRWDFSGWGPQEQDGKQIDGPWSMSLSSARNFKHVPLRIVPEGELWATSGSYRDDSFKHEKLLDFKAEPTFLEVVYAILWDLSFYGSPQERDAEKQELKRRVDELDRGEATTVSFEEVMAGLGIDDDE